MGLEDDVAYVAILLGSIGLGPLLRLVPPETGTGGGINFTNRKRLSTFLGLVIASLVSGWHITHLLIQAGGNMLILKSLSSRSCHLVSFVWCFTYLLFYRVSWMFGLPSPPNHTSAVIMILTLKLVGLAFEVHDSNEPVPSLEDQFHYGFNHVGLITGPYYRFSTWRGLTNDPWNPAVVPRPGLCSAAAWTRSARVPAYVMAFLISGGI
jgi:lysophospholipid acyltransferase 7